MSSLNNVTLIGYLGADPELRYTPSGTPVANFRIATSESWTDKQGDRQERTEWHRIVAWKKLGELCNEHLSKGRQVCVEGRLQTRQWTDGDGNKRFTTEIHARRVLFLGGRPADSTTTEPSGSDETDHDYGPPPMDEPFNALLDGGQEA